MFKITNVVNQEILKQQQISTLFSQKNTILAPCKNLFPEVQDSPISFISK